MPKAEPPIRKVYPGKGGVGRAHWGVTKTGLAIIRKMAANGCKLETIAGALGCSHDALEACRRRQPEVQEALDAGRAVMHDELVDILMQQARAGRGKCGRSAAPDCIHQDFRRVSITAIDQ